MNTRAERKKALAPKRSLSRRGIREEVNRG